MKKYPHKKDSQMKSEREKLAAENNEFEIYTRICILPIKQLLSSFKKLQNIYIFQLGQTSLFFISKLASGWSKNKSHKNPLLLSTNRCTASSKDHFFSKSIEDEKKEGEWWRSQKFTHKISPSTKVLIFFLLYKISFCSRNLCWCTKIRVVRSLLIHCNMKIIH